LSSAETFGLTTISEASQVPHQKNGKSAAGICLK
jgi:hypothetical protein